RDLFLLLLFIGSYPLSSRPRRDLFRYRRKPLSSFFFHLSSPCHPAGISSHNVRSTPSFFPCLLAIFIRILPPDSVPTARPFFSLISLYTDDVPMEHYSRFPSLTCDSFPGLSPSLRKADNGGDEAIATSTPCHLYLT